MAARYACSRCASSGINHHFFYLILY